MCAQDKKPSSTPEEEVWIAIAAFEQILEAMPADRASLEALSHAYDQIGDHSRAKDYLLRLAKVVIEEADGDAALQVARQLEPYAQEDPSVPTVITYLQGLTSSSGESGLPELLVPIAAGEAARFEAFNLADELSFAWTLLESNQLTQEEYASLVQDLTEMSSGESKATVSVLHALELRTFRNLERLMLGVSKEYAAPIVNVGLFDIQTAALNALPLEFMARRGALVFDFIGGEALVVVMNPHDAQLRKAINSLAGRKCHFFMTLPSEFDKVITHAREIEDKAKDQLVPAHSPAPTLTKRLSPSNSILTP